MSKRKGPLIMNDCRLPKVLKTNFMSIFNSQKPLTPLLIDWFNQKKKEANEKKEDQQVFIIQLLSEMKNMYSSFSKSVCL